MKKKYKITILLLALSLTIPAAGNNSELAKRAERMMVGILCDTKIVEDTRVTGLYFEKQLEGVSDEKKILDLKLKMSKSLKQAWVKQGYDISEYWDVLSLFNKMVNTPMNLKLRLAELWAESAVRRCPEKAGDYSATRTAAMTLFVTIASSSSRGTPRGIQYIR